MQRLFLRANALSPIFQEKLNKLLNHHFSRNTDLYPIFKSQPIKGMLDFQKNCPKVAPDPSDIGPESEDLKKEIINQENIPDSFITDTTDLNKKLNLISGISKNWRSPLNAENVITYAADPSLYGSFIGSLTNANLVHYEYCRMSSDLEDTVSRMMSNLVGFDPKKSIGLFTQGGTMCNLYGYLCGIRKSIPESNESGIECQNQRYKFIVSEAGHYSNKTVLSVLGSGYKGNLIQVELDEKNSMNTKSFYKVLENCFEKKVVVPSIILTLGSTDTFANDDVKTIVKMRDELCQKYGVKIKPHIHVDSAVGWAVMYFNNYDFYKNELGINDQTLEGLHKLVDNFKNIYLADSVTIDFHKWGYAPYVSTMILFKEKKDFYNMKFDSSMFTYFPDKDPTNKFQCTVECSRSAVGVYSAYSMLNALGIEGMRLVTANGLQNAHYARELLSQNKRLHFWAGGIDGPSVGFKLYPGDPQKEYQYERTKFPDYPEPGDEYSKRIKANSEYHEENIFKKYGNDTLATSWVKSIGHSNYNFIGHCCYLEGEKLVFFHPWTNRDHIEKYVQKQIQLCNP